MQFTRNILTFINTYKRLGRTKFEYKALLFFFKKKVFKLKEKTQVT